MDLVIHFLIVHIIGDSGTVLLKAAGYSADGANTKALTHFSQEAQFTLELFAAIRTVIIHEARAPGHVSSGPGSREPQRG